MGYDAGCNFAVGGSWEAPSEAHQGRLIAGNGLVTAKRVLIGNEPVVRITLAVAVSPENISWSVTKREDYPTNCAWCVSPVDNANYDVKFLGGGESLVDRSFDFSAIKFGQPQQGLGK